MALQDHFRPPLSIRRHWHAFHNAWATYLASDLNQRLPEGYFAEPNVQFGIEIDVATFEELIYEARRSDGAIFSSVALQEVWAAPAPTLTIPLDIAGEVVEVLVYSREAGPTLAGAIELVSPANKDRPSHRDAFVSKCVAYLQLGVGLVVVDVVTDRRANLHDALVARLGASEAASWDAELYAAAYRPVVREGQTRLDIWQETLVVDRALPTLPLWLRGNLCLPVELGATYDRTCREQRIGANGA
jgi:uncharacterized protein DUF4058